MKAHWQKLLEASKLAVVFCCLLLMAGCETNHDNSLTYKLWNDRNRRSLEEPSPQPRLALFETQNGKDVIVQYDTMVDKYGQSERRAYLLNENRKRIATHRKPTFTDPSSADGLKVIPVVSTEITDAPSLKIYAVVSGDGQRFVLYRKGMAPQRYGLPVYQKTFGLVKQVTLDPLRVALSPITATGDMITGAMAPTPDAEDVLAATSQVLFVATFFWLWAGAPGTN